MFPLLFDLGPIQIYAYGVLMALAFVLCTLWILKRGQTWGFNPEELLWLMGIVTLSGLLGARLLYVVYFPGYYMEDPWRILMDRGGLVWYGGVIAGIAAGLTTLITTKKPILVILDMFMAPLCLGLALGRIGCFLAGCCYGRPTTLPWGVQFPVSHQTYPLHVHPTQLYESIGAFLLMGLLIWVYRHYKHQVGTSLVVFLIGYGLMRFVIEAYRGDVVYWVGHWLSASQVISLLALGLGIGLGWWLKLPTKLKASLGN